MSTVPDFPSAIWEKSSYSGGTGGQCVEAARSLASPSGAVPVRDSKSDGGPALSIPTGAWSSFVTSVREGQ
ncbi:DUF397 domain-containing protein [Streptomyces griseocarneus]|nr:DUF397 domain-containing protein [Streptomyces griseocarneus]